MKGSRSEGSAGEANCAKLQRSRGRMNEVVGVF